MSTNEDERVDESEYEKAPKGPLVSERVEALELLGEQMRDELLKFEMRAQAMVIALVNELPLVGDVKVRRRIVQAFTEHQMSSHIWRLSELLDAVQGKGVLPINARSRKEYREAMKLAQPSASAEDEVTCAKDSDGRAVCAYDLTGCREDMCERCPMRDAPGIVADEKDDPATQQFTEEDASERRKLEYVAAIALHVIQLLRRLITGFGFTDINLGRALTLRTQQLEEALAETQIGRVGRAFESTTPLVQAEEVYETILEDLQRRDAWIGYYDKMVVHAPTYEPKFVRAHAKEFYILPAADGRSSRTSFVHRRDKDEMVIPVEEVFFIEKATQRVRYSIHE